MLQFALSVFVNRDNAHLPETGPVMNNYIIGTGGGSRGHDDGRFSSQLGLDMAHGMCSAVEIMCAIILYAANISFLMLGLIINRGVWNLGKRKIVVDSR